MSTYISHFESSIDPYAEYIHSIMDNEFYRRERSPAELFRGIESEKISTFSPEWWERWFRWQFQCYWVDDEEGTEYCCRGLSGTVNIPTEVVLPQTARLTRVPMTTAYSSRYYGGARIEQWQVEFLTDDPINDITWNMGIQDPTQPALLDTCNIQGAGHFPGMCAQYDNHVGEFLGINHSEPLDQPHQGPVFEEK